MISRLRDLLGRSSLPNSWRAYMSIMLRKCGSTAERLPFQEGFVMARPASVPAISMQAFAFHVRTLKQ